ncbi:MAG: host attachment protein [Tabrizicola sp.]
MKARQTLYLLAADQDFRLLRGSRGAFTELAHRRADEFPDVENPFGSEPYRSHATGVSFGTKERGANEEEERRRFARHAVSALEAEWANGNDDGIVLVAGPKMLGVLRDLMPKSLVGKVVAELPKDLVKMPVHDLPGHLADLPGV